MKACTRLAAAVGVLGAFATAVRTEYPRSIPVAPGTPAPVYHRLEAAARDGIKLIVHEWTPAQRDAGRPVAMFIHGIGMHGEPYGAIAPGFTRHGIPLVIPDLRGHGRSEGTRGDLAEPHVMRADLGAVMGLIGTRYPGAPVVLIGDSMGGLLAADYAWRGERRLAGLVLLVPAFGVHTARLEKPVAELVSALGSGRVALGTPDKIGASTRNAGFVRARLADPLALADVRLSYLVKLARLEQDWPRAAAEFNLPLFVCVAGNDRIVDNKATERFFEKAATPPADKTWRRFDEAFHTLCWDPITPALVEDLAQWVLRRASPGAGAVADKRGDKYLK
jgi:alpha-beta hydrolase superfamily lysophospholipase